jgi:hypothetical protein
MAKTQPTTAEVSPSKAKEEIIKEAKRMEEALLFSSKGHFAAAHFWSRFHLWIGIPMVLMSSIASASAFAQFDKGHIAAGILSIIVASLSGVMTFLNPNQKSSAHLNAGNHYDSLMNRVRMFWSIECWRDESDQVLTGRLQHYVEQKDKLNQSCPQIPPWAYAIARRGIESGEGEYAVDKSPGDVA